VPYAILDGYKSGTGPQKVLGLMQQACAARIERDQRFTAAEKSTGHKRALLFHAGLQAVAGLLGTLEDKGDDPILAFYPTVVSEIRRLDSGKEHPLAALYDTRQKKRDEWITTHNATFGELKKFDKAKDYKGAIRFIDAALKDLKAPDVRWRLEYARQVYLEWDGQYVAGLANARRLLAEPNRTPEQRESLLGRESYNLWNSGRVGEALAQHDRRIREAKDPKKRLGMLATKAQMVLSYRKAPGVDPAESIKVWKEYRGAAKPDTEDWRTATRFLGLQLQWQGQYREALKLHQEFIETEPADLRAKLFAAECHAALGEHEAARQLMREVQKALPDNPEREDDKQLKKWTLAQIARLQDQLGKHRK
jgi:tetratricopeptide (TPR) repeat protein